MTKEKLIKQIKGELAFLNSQSIKHLVHEGDFGACHETYPSIENRKKKLKKQLKELLTLKPKRRRTSYKRIRR